MSYEKWVDKYRPKNFEQVVGQKSIKVLEADSKNNEYYSVYIFVGQYGSGKTSTARILAADVNAKTQKDGWDSRLVQNILSGHDATSTVQEINASENKNVDTVRDLIESLNFTRIGRPIIILDECQNMTKLAMDTLLTTLENPPNDTIFILVTTDASSIPSTVRSRAKVVNFVPVSDNEIEQHLYKIAEEEKFDTSDKKTINAIQKAIIESDGSLRNAVKLLEQHLKMSDIDNNELSPFELIDNVLESFAKKNIPNILTDVATALEELSPNTIINSLFISVRESFKDVNNNDFQSWSIDDKVWAAETLAKAMMTLNTSGSLRIALESALISAINPPHDQVKRWINEAIKEIPEVKVIINNNNSNDWPPKDISEVKNTEKKAPKESVNNEIDDEEEKRIEAEADRLLDKMFNDFEEETTKEEKEKELDLTKSNYGDNKAAEIILQNVNDILTSKEKLLRSKIRKINKESNFMKYTWTEKIDYQEDLGIESNKDKTLVIEATDEFITVIYDKLDLDIDDSKNEDKVYDFLNSLYEENFDTIVQEGKDYIAVLY